LDLNLSFVLHDNPIHAGETKDGAFARRLGGKKRIENYGLQFLWDTYARICDRNRN